MHSTLGFPSSEGNIHWIRHLKVLNSCLFRASPPLSAMDVLLLSGRNVQFINGVYWGNGLWFLSYASAFYRSDVQEVRRKESIFSEGGASESPAAQRLPLGTILLKPQWTTVMSHGCRGECAVRWGRGTNSWQPLTTWSRRAVLCKSLGNINCIILTGSIQTVQYYKRRTASTTIPYSV